MQQTVASSQSITLPSHNITIKDAFSEIEKQTGMSVDYDESVINLNKQVNASVNNKSLNETLALILKESGCTFVIRNNHIIISAQTVQQQQKQVTISGTVSDNLGPIAGANVVEKGTTNGIITDMDGNYTLSVPQGAVIQFSYIGYVTKEITVDSQEEHQRAVGGRRTEAGRSRRRRLWDGQEKRPGRVCCPCRSWELCRNHRISAWVRHYRGRFPD
ncbi:carboxypeptidase-like regulatory domain-containing protein [Parabacteroides merdae]|nr:carboxypeptidase-like regulatory domain-containing protein [Parabacteroides merdae]